MPVSALKLRKKVVREEKPDSSATSWTGGDGVQPLPKGLFAPSFLQITDFFDIFPPFFGEVL